MQFHNLHELYLEELRSLYHAEKLIVDALPKMIEKAESADLKNALTAHLRETEGHVARIEQVFEGHGEQAKAGKCKIMEALLDEGADLVDDAKEGVVDAVIIAAAQKVEHYEVAAYGTVRAWAEQMGQPHAVMLLTETLKEEKHADQKLTEISSYLNAEVAQHTR